MKKRGNLFFLNAIAFFLIFIGFSCTKENTTTDPIAPSSTKDTQGNLLIINNSGKKLVLYKGTVPFRTIPNSAEDFLIQLPNQNRDKLDLKIYRYDDVSTDFENADDTKLYKRWMVVLAGDNNLSTRKTWLISSNTQEKNTGEIEFSYAGGTDNSVDVYLNSKSGAKISSLEPGSNYIKTVGIDYGVHTILYRYWYSDNTTTNGEIEVAWTDNELVNGNKVSIFVVLKEESSVKSIRVPHYQGSGTLTDTYGEFKVYNNTSAPIEIYAGDVTIEKVIYTNGSSVAASIISANSSNSNPFILKEGTYVFKAINVQTAQVVSQVTKTIVAGTKIDWVVP